MSDNEDYKPPESYGGDGNDQDGTENKDASYENSEASGGGQPKAKGRDSEFPDVPDYTDLFDEADAPKSVADEKKDDHAISPPGKSKTPPPDQSSPPEPEPPAEVDNQEDAPPEQISDDNAPEPDPQPDPEPEPDPEAVPAVEEPAQELDPVVPAPIEAEQPQEPDEPQPEPVLEPEPEPEPEPAEEPPVDVQEPPPPEPEVPVVDPAPAEQEPEPEQDPPPQDPIEEVEPAVEEPDVPPAPVEAEAEPDAPADPPPEADPEPEPEPEPEPQPDPIPVEADPVVIPAEEPAVEEPPVEPEPQPVEEPVPQPEPEPEPPAEPAEEPAVEEQPPVEAPADPVEAEPEQPAQPDDSETVVVDPPQDAPDDAPQEPEPEPEQPPVEPEPEVKEQDPPPEPVAEDPPEAQPEPDVPAEPEPEPEPPAPVDVPEEKDAGAPPVVVAEPEPEPAEPAQVIAVRKEIRAMSREEQDRFFDAVHKMMENKDGPGTSEFFRIAGYHGNPGNHYCAHGVESFPGWHRIYLLEFQNALQEADRNLGKNGNIGLPYWDWTVGTNDGLPDIIRERFAEFPPGLFPDNNDYDWPVIRRNGNRAVTSRLRRGRVVERANNCLLATQHWAHASTANSRRSRYPSLEQPHNSVHVACGRPMNSVAWAAFDIIFWLHHCNIDRIYEGYLKLEPDSAEEFEAFQDNQRRDIFDQEFLPFSKPDGSRYMPKDTFSTLDLGYEYAEIPASNAQALQEAPTYAIFEQIKIADMNGSCYELHVFAVPDAEADDWVAPEDVEAYEDSPAYAGLEVIFGKGPACEACKVRPPYDLRVNISAALRDQGLSRYDAVLKVMTVETTADNAVRPLEETPVPVPVIDGPLFEDREAPLEEANKDAARPEDVRALQEYLAQFGYYAADIDGDFGPVTDKAVRKYQELAGLEVDGQVGPITKKQILNAIRCGEKDVHEGASVDNASALEFAPPRDQGPFYDGKTEITYSVGVVPGYLRRPEVMTVLESIFDQYADAAGLVFLLSDDEEKADIKIAWSMGKGEKKSVRFDGAGGVLARGGEGFLELDEAERWSVNPDETGNLEDRTTWRRGDPLVLFQHVALHELGHALGLAHSNDKDDVMAPYYNPGLIVLSESDKKRIAAIYGYTGASDPPQLAIEEEKDEIVEEHIDKVSELQKKIASPRSRAKSKKRLSGLETAAEPTLQGTFAPKRNNAKAMAAMFEKNATEEKLDKPNPVRSPRTPKGALAAKFNMAGKIDLTKMKPGAYDPSKIKKRERSETRSKRSNTIGGVLDTAPSEDKAVVQKGKRRKRKKKKLGYEDLVSEDEADMAVGNFSSPRQEEPPKKGKGLRVRDESDGEEEGGPAQSGGCCTIL